MKNNNSKKKIIYKYDIGIDLINVPNKPKEIKIAEEFKKILDYINGLELKKRKIDFSSEQKVLYLEKFEESDIEGKKLYYAKFASAKYNQVREVIDKNTLKSRGRLKKINDGDKEINHVVFFYNNNCLTAAFEYNDFGILNLNKIIEYINNFIFKYFESQKETPYIRGFECHNVVNRNFIEELENLKTITMAKFIVRKTMLNSTDFAEISGRNEIKNEIEIIFKRSRKNSKIPTEDIKNCYNQMNLNMITKIYIEGMEKNNNHIRFNTEEMKEKIEKQVKINIFGEVISDDIFGKLKEYLVG